MPSGSDGRQGCVRALRDQEDQANPRPGLHQPGIGLQRRALQQQRGAAAGTIMSQRAVRGTRWIDGHRVRQHREREEEPRAGCQRLHQRMPRLPMSFEHRVFEIQRPVPQVGRYPVVLKGSQSSPRKTVDGVSRRSNTSWLTSVGRMPARSFVSGNLADKGCKSRSISALALEVVKDTTEAVAGSMAGREWLSPDQCAGDCRAEE